MRKPPWFPFYADDWRASLAVRKMTAEQRGYYISLLIEQWASPEGNLPNNMGDLSFLAGAKSQAHFEATCEPVLEKFPVQIGGHTRANTRLDHEAIKTRTLAEQKRLSGQHGANKRWGKELSYSTPIADQSQTNSKGVQQSQSQPQAHPHAVRDSKNQSPSLLVKPKEEKIFECQFFSVEEGFDRTMKAAAPGVDTVSEYRKMEAWLVANPDRRKKRYGRFIHNWISTAHSRISPPVLEEELVQLRPWSES